MAKKSYNINFEYDYDFILIGIYSPLKDYHLCYKINKQIGTLFYRSEHDVMMDFSEGIEKAQFSLYEYWDHQYENQWYLLPNKCQILCDEKHLIQGTIFDEFIRNEKKIKHLIPENAKVDYYLQVHGIYSEQKKLQLIEDIKKLNLVTSAHEVNIKNLTSKENLIIK